MTRRTLWLIAPWAVFGALALGWIIYWHAVAGEAERRIEAWAAEQSAQGGEVSIGRVVRHGFPVLMRLELRDISYAPARGGWRGETARADLHIQPINPQHLILQARAPISISRSNGAVTTIVADALIASLRTRGEALVQAGVEADNLTLDDANEEGVLAAQKLVVNLRPDPRASGAYQLAFDAQNITLPRPVRSFEAFGLEAPALRAAIVVERGAALMNASREDPLGPWREAGGQLRFEALALRWGPLTATGAGRGGLDDQRRLTGELNLPLEQPGPIFSTLANGPNVSADARRALALLAASFAVSGESITLDVDADNGVLRLEGLPVRALPPVY